MTSEQTAGISNDGASGEGVAAKRYALAALEVAREHNDTEAWLRALPQIADFMTDMQVRRVLENSRVGQEPKQRLIEAALGDLPPLALNFARLLVRKQRTALAAEIAGIFQRLVEEEQGLERAVAITAVPISDAEREALRERLRRQTGHEVILEVRVDPSLLGGVVVQIGDRLVDASTRARLDAMREQLVRTI